MNQNKPERKTDSHLERGSYYGDVVARRDCGGVLLAELRHDSARRLPSHSHESAFLSLLLAGSYSEQFARQTFDYKPFTVLFHRPGFSHRDEIGRGGGRLFMVEVPNPLLRRLEECSAIPDFIAGPRGSQISLLANRLYQQYASPGVAGELIIEGLMMEILGQVARDVARDGSAVDKQPPRWLNSAVDMLHAEFDRNLTVGAIAREVGVHPFHLSRVFRCFYRQSIGEYTNKLRVEFACRELLKPKAQMADIAFRAGFADQSHFCRVFKQVIGVTPGVFRRATAAREDGIQ